MIDVDERLTLASRTMCEAGEIIETQLRRVHPTDAQAADTIEKLQTAAALLRKIAATIVGNPVALQ